MVEAAEGMLREPGSKRVSLRGMAKRAGVGVASVYEYFADQDGVVNALIDKTAPALPLAPRRHLGR